MSTIAIPQGPYKAGHRNWPIPRAHPITGLNQ